MNLMDWVRSHFGRPPNPPAHGPDPAVKRSQKDREEAERRLRSLEAQVRVMSRDHTWMPTRIDHRDARGEAQQ